MLLLTKKELKSHQSNKMLHFQKKKKNQNKFAKDNSHQKIREL